MARNVKKYACGRQTTGTIFGPLVRFSSGGLTAAKPLGPKTVESRNEVELTVCTILSERRTKIKVFLNIFGLPGVRGANVIVRLSKYDFWIL